MMVGGWGQASDTGHRQRWQDFLSRGTEQVVGLGENGERNGFSFEDG